MDDSRTAVQRSSRLTAVSATRLLDTGADESFDRLARLAGTLLDVPYAFVTIVDGTRSFWKSCIGVDATDVTDRQNPVEESFCQYVVNTDEPLIVGDARVNEVTRLNPSIEKMGVIAWAGYPLRSIDGHVLGTFCVVDTEVRDWSPDEIEILAALAGAVEGEVRLRTLLDQTAASAENVQREMLGRERLARLAQRLAAADTTEAVAASITDFGAEVFGGTFASLGLLDPLQRELVIHGTAADNVQLSMNYSIVSMTADLPIVDAVRNDETVLLGNRADMARRYPHLMTDFTELRLGSAASVPLRHSEGGLLGALTVGWPHTNEFTTADEALLTTVSLMCAQAIERTQLGDLRRELVSSLQNELLPAAPTIAGLSFAVRYIPANLGIGVGGDWYDVIALDDGRAVIVVGDVVGHGIEAAARMTQVRGAINALAWMFADDLSRVFDEAEQMLRYLQDRFIATVVVFVVDPVAGSVSYLSAGHPPALLCEVSGSTRLLDEGTRPVLGSGQGPAEVGVMAFPEGAVLVAFTDGLVERREQTTDEGTERIAAQLQHAGALPDSAALDPELLAEEIIDNLVADQLVTDDVALVIVRRSQCSKGHS